jgi:hypothetical protein
MTQRAPSTVLFSPFLLVLAFVPGRADASVSLALTIDDVARDADVVVRATPLARTSTWEEGRIVTNTRLEVDAVIAGKGAGSEISVRTLGGVVGDIGQRVEGEAVFAPNAPSIIFLKRRPNDGAFMIAARAQGQLLVTKDAGTAREVVRVRNLGALLPKPQRVPYALPAASQLVTSFDGHDAREVTNEAARAWERTHAH